MNVCGQVFDTALLGKIQECIASSPDITRREVSLRVCSWLNWRSSKGNWQEGGCRKALAILIRKGLITWPKACVRVPSRRDPPLLLNEDPVCCTLEELGVVELVRIDDARSAQAKHWRSLMHTHHYLGDRPMCGAQQSVFDSQRRPCAQSGLACSGFSRTAYCGRLAAAVRSYAGAAGDLCRSIRNVLMPAATGRPTGSNPG